MDGTTFVIATRNRWHLAAKTVRHLGSEYASSPIIVVDDCSDDYHSRESVANFKNVRLLTLPRRHGGAAREHWRASSQYAVCGLLR